MPSALLILGNGFTIDFLNHLKKAKVAGAEDIDVINLFSKGSNVKWPSDMKPGFLSYKRCPNLWKVGARPYLDKEQSNKIIEDIMTCVNASAIDSIKFTSLLNKKDPEPIYLMSYVEMIHYLKYLFVDYNNKITNEEIEEHSKNWPWMNLIRKLNNKSDIDKIHIVTFNYDVWLERCLEVNNISFSVSPFENKNSKVCIYKPHGSISFINKETTHKEQYGFDYIERVDLGSLSDYTLCSDYKNLEIPSKRHALLPPSGGQSNIHAKIISSKKNKKSTSPISKASINSFTWSQEIRSAINEQVGNIDADDLFVIGGLSYWHVDRDEIDEILRNLNHAVDVHMVNPNPPSPFVAVLSTFFDKVTVHATAKILEECV